MFPSVYKRNIASPTADCLPVCLPDQAKKEDNQMNTTSLWGEKVPRMMLNYNTSMAIV